MFSQVLEIMLTVLTFTFSSEHWDDEESFAEEMYVVTVVEKVLGKTSNFLEKR